MGALLAALLLGAPALHAALQADGTVGSDPLSNSTLVTGVLFGRLDDAIPLGWGDVAVGYSPRLTWVGHTAFRRANLTFFNTANLRLEVPFGRTKVRLTQSAGVGQQDFSVLAQGLRLDPQAPPPPPPDRLPAERFVPTFSSDTGVAVDHQFSRSLQLLSAVGFAIGGGLGHDGRSYLPLQRTGRARLSGTWKVTLHGDLTSSAEASTTLIGPGGRSTTAGIQAGWAQRFTTSSSGSVNVGLSLIENQGLAVGTAAVGQTGRLVVTTARLALVQALRLPIGGLTIGAEASAAPALDPLGGGTYLRGVARTDCLWTVTPSLAVNAAAMGDRVLSGALAGAFGGAAEVSGSYRASRELSFRISLRAAVLTPVRVLLSDESPQTQWTAVAGVRGDL